MSRVKAENLVNFTRGLNLRGDAFELADGESPEMLNVDVDSRGGLVARQGWTRQNTTDIDTPWDPRLMFIHELSSGSDVIYLTNNNTILTSTNKGVSWTDLGGTLTASANPHLADFAPWGDTVYTVKGVNTAGGKFDSSATWSVIATQAEGANFSEITAPTTAFPRAEVIASHAGHMFVGWTEESGVEHPHRLRWSHPNDPEAWRSSDYWDIEDGGGPITALVPMSDHLLVFKQSAVWALFGYDADSFQLVNVSREVGAVTRAAVARSEQAAFCFSHPRGVYMILDGRKPTEISTQLRPAFDGNDFVKTLQDDIFLGWIDSRLFVSVPYNTDAVATDAEMVFVWDPSIGDGAWIAYRAATGEGLGPFGQGGFGGGEQLSLAAARLSKSVVKIHANDLPIDDMDGTPTNFDAFFRTKWVDAGWPTLKKRWRRPDFVVKERDSEYSLQVDVFRDYDEANVERTRVVTVDAGSEGALWGSFTWGDGTLYGPSAKGSRIERGGSIGPAAAVQLLFTGQAGKAWGVDAVVFKLTPRRLR